MNVGLWVETVGGGETRGEWVCDGVRATSGPVARPGVKGGEKASESSHGESGSVEDTLDSLLECECECECV